MDHRAKNRILSLYTPSSQSLSNPEEIENHTTSFYISLLFKKEVDRNEVQQ